MDELRHLQSRIASLGELRNLVRTMRALAASRLQEAQGALDGIRGYAGVVADAIEAAAALRRGALPETWTPAGRRRTLVVLCSEQATQPVVNTGTLYT